MGGVTSAFQRGTTYVLLSTHYNNVIMFSELYTGILYTINLSFIDINECDTNNGGCWHDCNNVIGSFACACADGYQVDPDDSFGCLGIHYYAPITILSTTLITCTLKVSKLKSIIINISGT